MKLPHVVSIFLGQTPQTCTYTYLDHSAPQTRAYCNEIHLSLIWGHPIDQNSLKPVCCANCGCFTTPETVQKRRARCTCFCPLSFLKKGPLGAKSPQSPRGSRGGGRGRAWVRDLPNIRIFIQSREIWSSPSHKYLQECRNRSYFAYRKSITNKLYFGEAA